MVIVGINVDVFVLVGGRIVQVGEKVFVGEFINVEVIDGVNVRLGVIPAVPVRVLVPVTGMKVFVAVNEFSDPVGVGELLFTTSSFGGENSVAVGIGCWKTSTRLAILSSISSSLLTPCKESLITSLTMAKSTPGNANPSIPSA